MLDYLEKKELLEHMEELYQSYKYEPVGVLGKIIKQLSDPK
jgi:hypothetical protein